MTNANMKLVVLNVTLEDQLKLPEQKLEQGEFIVRKVIALNKLYDELKGKSRIMSLAVGANQRVHRVRQKGIEISPFARLWY